MKFDLRSPFDSVATPARHKLPATPETVYWGYIDRDQPPCITVNDGDIIEVEAVTHHAGDAPDLLMDDGIRSIWSAIAEPTRGPGVHILTGPIHVLGAEPGDTLAVKILSMWPRTPYGSNVAANWGLLYDIFKKERVTIYELDRKDDKNLIEFPSTAHPIFGFDFKTRPIYDLPGVIIEPGDREPFSRAVTVPVRPHFGVMGVAPATAGRQSSIPPGVWGGNVDNWRLGPGAVMCYPVNVEGANLYIGDPHYAQGDGEVCGTAIEASLNAVIQVKVIKGVGNTSPILDTADQWFTHGFGSDLDEALRMATEQMIWLLREKLSFTADEAYSLASVAIDVGVTQVVDGTLGCHAAVRKDLAG